MGNRGGEKVMGGLLYRDERVKLGIYAVIIFIVQGLIFLGINSYLINKTNKAYIKQNTEIVGTLMENNKPLAEEIIPIITGKESGNYKEGEKILNEYSYNNILPYRENYLFKDINRRKDILTIVPVILGLIGILIGNKLILNPLYKDIKYLTRRAEDIVENRYRDERRYGTGKGGSLDKLFNKFNLMEDRINNNIELLKEEKINLKNIINDISHQLKTPVTALTMYTDLLTDHRDMEERDVDMFVNSSKEQLDRMEWLVLTLLKYARLESNVVVYNKEKLSLKNTIEEAIEPLKIKVKEKNQSLKLEMKTNVIFYHDRNWLAESISNIVKNAIEHTGEWGEIDVKLEETELAIIISIKDNGEGIDKKEIKKIFKRFYKGETSTNPTSIGIGLCLSKAIVNAHNGDISVESDLGTGTTFYLKFLKSL